MSYSAATRFERTDLPALAEIYFAAADAIAHEEVSRDMSVTYIRQDPYTMEIVTEYVANEQPLNPFFVLRDLRNMKTFNGNRRTVCRENTQIAAALGGSALYEIDHIAPAGEFSAIALDGIRSAMRNINSKMIGAFNGLARPDRLDVDARVLLFQAKDILKKQVQ